MHPTDRIPIARYRVFAAAFLGVLLAVSPRIAFAQAVPAPAEQTDPNDPNAKKKTPQGDETITLSVFEVSPDDDTGYQAMNTTSGSRLSTPLKNTAASISPFTAEFLSDIAATNVNEMLAYAANAELNAGDSEGAGFNNPRDFSSAGGEPFRIRGIPGGVSTDYVENATPQDLYNIERAEVASGANSILFGSGDAGGLVSLTSKVARLQRNRAMGKFTLGSGAYQRYETDINRVLIPHTLAVRFNGLYQNAKSWRTYEFNDAHRAAGSFTYKPFKWTTISANYERGLTENSVGLKWNLTDQVTRWMAAGRPITDATAANTSLGLSNLGANQRFTYIPQDGLTINMRNENRTNIAPGTASTLLPDSIFPYHVNWAGPDTKLWRNFHNYKITIDQQIMKDLSIQGAYLKNVTDARARTFVYNGNVMDFMGDPNLTIPAQSGTGTITNSRAGQLYLETNEADDRTRTENEIKRVTVAYHLRLGKWFGNHQVAALYENATRETHAETRREILVDQNNRPVAGALGVAAGLSDPANAQNLLYRRTYVTEGNYDTYALTGLYTPIAPFQYNGLTLSSRLVTTGAQDSIKDTKSWMGVLQSSWFANRLDTTFGYRKDDIVYLDNTAKRIAPSDPRVSSGLELANELGVEPVFDNHVVHPKTVTEGGVLHVTKRISLLYNHSTNVGAPRFNRSLLPTGSIPDTPKGTNKEYGFMFDLFGDDRYFLRATYFETAQVGDAGVSPSGAVLDAAGLGRSQVKTILGALRDAGKITAAQYDAGTFNWNAATIDTASKGFEVEAIANPIRNWTIRANYSHSSRDRLNFYKEGFAYFAQKFPEWRALAAGNPALMTIVETNINDIQTNELDGQATATEQGFGSIPHKATLTTRYSFVPGGFMGEQLKGLFVGGGLRYQSGTFSQTDTRAASAGGTGKDYFTKATFFADGFTGYRFRMWNKMSAKIQVNVTNMFNSDRDSLARYNGTFTGPRRIYLRPPRQWKLSYELEF
jgi:outer membrane receptor protein involved in Fe transport